MEDSEQGARTSPAVSAPEPWLSIAAASLLFTELDLTRNKRSIRRYCEKKKLDCRSIENDNRQFERRVSRDSIIQFVKEHKSLAVTSGRDRTRPGMTDNDRMPTHPMVTGVIEQDLRERVGELKEQLFKKDEQIATQNQTITTMLERDRETNILIQNLHNLLSVKQLGGGAAEEEHRDDGVIHNVRNSGDNTPVVEEDQ